MVLMSVSLSIVCPSCKKKFKGRPEFRGKKVRCPSCSHTFVVGALVPDQAEDAIKAAPGAKAKAAGLRKPVASKAPVAKGVAPPPGDDGDEYSGQANPYGVTELDLAPRCPHCANEMESDDAIICLYCGYNTETREIGQTTTVIGTTAGEHFKYLLPGLGSALFLVLLAVWCLYFSVAFPATVNPKAWWAMLDHESMRMWNALLCLGAMWPAGIYAYKRLIMEPRPKEKKKD
jgi:hypothetical protein